LFGEQLTLYSFGPYHPMNSSRIRRFFDLFESSGLRGREGVILLEPILASKSLITLFHDEEYVEFIRRASAFGYGYLDYGDTPAFLGVYEASAYVVGSTLRAFEAVASGEVNHAFNPMGGLHHARRGSAAGFCVFNDIGVLIEVAKMRGMRRILYIDIDAHHGDGVFYEYEEDPEVFIIDFHEDGRFLYPGTGFAWERGKGAAEETKLNVPLHPGSGDEEFLRKLEEALPFLEASRPDLVILQAGGDGIEGDPITHLCYTHRVHEKVAEVAREIADRYAGGRLIVLGGGGYEATNTAGAWLRVIEKLLV